MSSGQEFVFIIIIPLILALIVVNVLWYALSRVDGRFAYNAKTATLIAVGFVLLRSTDYFSLLVQRATTHTQAAQQQPASPEQAKQDFLRTVEYFANNPNQYNNEIKAKIFQQYQGLFPKGLDDVKVYRQEVGNAFLCQLSLNQDALDTAKKKKVVRSQTTDQCSQLPGNFYGRAKLIPDEIMANHQKMLENIAKGDKSAPKAKDLEQVVQQQKQRVQIVQKIFE